MSGFKRIVLHCGLHKTGTSYLQHVFRRNIDVLKRHSIAYPEYRNEQSRNIHNGNHSYAIVVYDGVQDLASFFESRFIFSSDADTLLLSAEEFSNNNHMARFLPRLKEYAGNAEVSFIYYLRRFDHLLESVYAESVKRTLVGTIRNASYQLEYDKIISPVLNIYGRESLIVRPYQKSHWPSGEIGQDFCTAISQPEIWQEIKDGKESVQNISLPRSHTFLLSNISERSAKAALLDYFQNQPLKLPPDPNKFFLSPSERRNLNTNHHSMAQPFFDKLRFGDLGEMLDLYNFPEESNWTEFQPYWRHFYNYMSSFSESAYSQ